MDLINSKNLLEAFNKEMTPSQIKEAQRLTEECVTRTIKGVEYDIYAVSHPRTYP